MAKQWWILASLALAACGEIACGEKAQLPHDLFPPSAGPGWNLVETRDLAVSDTPDPVPRNSVEQIRAATYKSGDGEIQARVYLLSSAEVGAALGTRWRPSADTVFFDHGPYFVVVKWQSADRKVLQAFVADLQRRLGAVNQQRPANSERPK